LFLSDAQRVPFLVGGIEPATSVQVEETARTINLNTGLGMDCIPGSMLQTPCPTIRAKLTEVINHIFKLGTIPLRFSCARLHFINKLKAGIPTIDDVLPIMISSPIVKMIEAVVLRELKEILEPRIAKNQVGLLSRQSTQLQILHLLGKIQDVKTSPYLRCGWWLCRSVDFRSASAGSTMGPSFRNLRAQGSQRGR